MSVVERYGDPVRYRLAAEFWRMTDDLMPKILAGIEYLSESHTISPDWVDALEEVATLSLDLKFAITGFSMMLTKDDANSIRSFDETYTLSTKRPNRQEVISGKMEGRAEALARRRLSIEDRAIALYLQLQDVRGVAFKNRFWDQTRKPGESEHKV